MITALIVVTIPFIIYMLLNAITVRVANVHFGTAIPVTMIASVILMIISHAILGTFWGAIILMYCLSAASLVYLIYSFSNIKSSNSKSINTFIQNYFSKGFYAFLILWVLIVIWDCGRRLNFFDEFAHWGMMVKTMYRLDDYYTVPASNLMIHKDYPPFSSLINLIWVMLSHGYSEKGCIMSSHLYELAILILPAIEYMPDNRKVRSSLYTIIITILTVIIIAVTESYFPSIYADTPLMCSVAYCLLLTLDTTLLDQKYGYITLGLAYFSIIICKQTGIALALIPAFALIWNIITSNKYSGHKPIIIFKSLLLILPSVICSHIWNTYVDSYNISKEFDMSNTNWGQAISEIVSGQGEYSQNFNSIIEGLLFKNVLGFRIHISYAGAFLIITIVCALLYLFKIIKPMRMLGLWLAYLCGTAGYAFIMMVTYTFFIVGRNLSGYSRYASTFLMMEFVSLFLFVIIEIMTSTQKHIPLRWIIAFTVVLLLTVNMKRLYKISPMRFQETSEFDEWREIAARIDSEMPDEGSFYLLNDPDHDIKYVVQYINDKNTLSYAFCDYTFSTDSNDMDMVSNILSAISGVDYLYIVDIPEGLSPFLITSDGTDISASGTGLYEVVNSEGKMYLQKYNIN